MDLPDGTTEADVIAAIESRFAITPTVKPNGFELAMPLLSGLVYYHPPSARWHIQLDGYRKSVTHNGRDLLDLLDEARDLVWTHAEASVGPQDRGADRQMMRDLRKRAREQRTSVRALTEYAIRALLDERITPPTEG